MFSMLIIGKGIIAKNKTEDVLNETSNEIGRNDESDEEEEEEELEEVQNSLCLSSTKCCVL